MRRLLTLLPLLVSCAANEPVAVRSAVVAPRPAEVAPAPAPSPSAPAPPEPSTVPVAAGPEEAAPPAPSDEPESALPAATSGDPMADLEDDDDDIEDGGDELGLDPGEGVAPAVLVSDAEIARLAPTNPDALGSMSLGSPSAGRLFGGVQMPKGNAWVLLDPADAWGTQDTVDALVRCIGIVHSTYPETPRVAIGHIGARRGGHLSPHVSHQSGRDVDIGYYFKPGTKGAFVKATADNLDRERTWTLLRAFITQTDVDLILIDTAVQRLLRDYALASGEEPAFVDEVFQVSGKSKRPVIRHAKGHANHIHVRFVSPRAQELARRAYPYLPKPAKAATAVEYVTHKVKKGNTLGSIANRYGTTVEAILALNGMKKVDIKPGQILKIARRSSVSTPPPKVTVPKRKTAPPPK